MKFSLTKLNFDPFQEAIDAAILTILCAHAWGKNIWSRKKFIHDFIDFRFTSKCDFRGVWPSPPGGRDPQNEITPFDYDQN